jgi:hypothetical protein
VICAITEITRGFSVPGCNIQGPGQQKVSGEHHLGGRPPGVGRGPSPAHRGPVHHIVMQQGGGVQVLENGGKPHRIFFPVSAHAGGMEKQQGPQPLAAAEQQMGGDPPHQVQMGGQVLFQGLLHLHQVRCHLFHDLRLQIRHAFSPAMSYSYPSVILT